MNSTVHERLSRAAHDGGLTALGGGAAIPCGQFWKVVMVQMRDTQRGEGIPEMARSDMYVIWGFWVLGRMRAAGMENSAAEQWAG